MKVLTIHGFKPLLIRSDQIDTEYSTRADEMKTIAIANMSDPTFRAILLL
jgi:hypothetical protein